MARRGKKVSLAKLKGLSPTSGMASPSAGFGKYAKMGNKLTSGGSTNLSSTSGALSGFKSRARNFK